MATPNAYAGDAPVEIGGRVLVLAYDWRALAKIASMPADSQARAIAGDVAALARIVAVGLERHHPEMDEAAVLAASPAVLPTVQAVVDALGVAWYGPGGFDGGSGAADHPPSAPLTRSARGWRRLFARG
jgi:hypothetical protein